MGGVIFIAYKIEIKADDLWELMEKYINKHAGALEARIEQLQELRGLERDTYESTIESLQSQLKAADSVNEQKEARIKELEESLRYSNQLVEEERRDHSNGLIHAQSKLTQLEEEKAELIGFVKMIYTQSGMSLYVLTETHKLLSKHK